MRGGRFVVHARYALGICALALYSSCAATDDSRSGKVIGLRELRRLDVESVAGSELIADVAWTHSSSIMAAFSGGAELLLLRWSADEVHRIAGPGSGPGEAKQIQWVLRMGDSAMATIDATLMRAYLWDSLGTLVSSVDLGSRKVLGAWETRGGIALKVGAGATAVAFLRLNGDAGESERREYPSTTALPLRSDATCDFCPAAVSTDGTLAMAVSDTSYRILRVDAAGRALAPIEQATVPAVRRSAEEIDSINGVWDRVAAVIGSDERISPANVNRFRERGRDLQFKPRFTARGLRYDEDGRLWAQLAVNAGDSARVDVFSRLGEIVGTLRLPPGSTVRQVAQGRLLVTEEHEDGRVVIVEYQTTFPD